MKITETCILEDRGIIYIEGPDLVEGESDEFTVTNYSCWQGDWNGDGLICDQCNWSNDNEIQDNENTFGSEWASTFVV